MNRQPYSDAEELCDDIFYGRVYLCNKCRRKNEYGCSNRICLEECRRMVEKKHPKATEQMSLF